MARRVYRFENTLRSIPLSGKRVLEIGAGDGIFSCLLSLSGVESVTSLEPELAGHSNGASARFETNVQRFGLNNVVLVKESFQDYQGRPGSFDLIISVASVNHLEEEACVRLGYDENAKRVYMSLFEKLYTLLDHGGKIVITDCSSRNVFSWLSRRCGIANPIAPTIKWYGHQPPGVWAELLTGAGFVAPRWRWLFTAPFWFGAEKLLNNSVMAYLTISHFVLQASKPDNKQR